jgi:hypothetical protein
MDPIRLFSIISWIALPTVMFGGYSLLGLMARGSLHRFVGLNSPRYRDARALAWPEQYPETEESNETPQKVGMRRYSTSKLCDVFYAYTGCS